MKADYEILDFGEYTSGGLRPGLLSVPGDLLQDYYDGDFGDGVGGVDGDLGGDVVGGEDEMEDGELLGEVEKEVTSEKNSEGLRKGMVLPDNLLEDYYALETEYEGTTGLTVSTEDDFSTGLNRHFESWTELAKSTSGRKSFTGNPSTTLQPSHNEHWKGEGKEKGDRVGGEKVKDKAIGEEGEEQLREGLGGEKEDGAGAFLIPHPKSLLCLSICC